MLFKKIKINKRLIKKAEFLDGFECNNTRNNFLSIYINPTGREIMQAKAESRYGSIRGLIMSDGTVYCWCGDVLHDDLPRGADLPVNSGDAFRFACEGDWIFDLHQSCTFAEGIKKFKNLIGVLSKFGDLDGCFLQFYFASDSGYDYKKYVDDLDDIGSTDIEFDSIDAIDELIRRIDNNIVVRPEDEDKSVDEYEDDEW